MAQETAFKKALDTEEDGTTNINYDLLLPKGASTSYWIASRCVATKSNYAGYSICMVAGGACYSNGLYVSPDEYYAQYDFNGEKALRPIVTLDSSLITKVNGADWVVSEQKIKRVNFKYCVSNFLNSFFFADKH